MPVLTTFIFVDPAGIEPALVQCECTVIPLNYGPVVISERIYYRRWSVQLPVIRACAAHNCQIYKRTQNKKDGKIYQSICCKVRLCGDSPEINNVSNDPHNSHEPCLPCKWFPTPTVIGFSKPMLHCAGILFGPPEIESGLQAPHACVLPLYYGPLRTRFSEVDSVLWSGRRESNSGLTHPKRT